MMTMCRLCLLVGGLWMLGALGVLAQPISFEQISVADGLSHTWAKGITKDSQGFLWVGTFSGLNRYDGNTITIFRTEKGKEGSLSDNFIQVVREDSRGHVWVGTFSGGINRFDRATETFVAYRNSPNPHSLSDDRIHAIYEDAAGRLWVGTQRGLDLYDYDQDFFDRFHLMKDGQAQLISGVVSAIQEDTQGRLWVGTDSGLYRIDMEREEIRHYGPEPGVRGSLSHGYVTSLYLDENGHLWVGTLGGGLNRYAPEQDGFVHWRADGPEGLSHDRILALAGNGRGQVYIGTEGGGLNVLDLQRMDIRVYVPEVGKPNSLSSNSVHALYYDEESGTTWVGTYHAGLNYFSQWDKPFMHYRPGVGGLNSGNILCLTEGPNGKLYVGTDGGGVNVIDRGTGRVRYLTHRPGDAGSLQSNAVLSVLVDRNESLWVGTFSGGLDVLRKGASGFEHIPVDAASPRGLSHGDISALYEDGQGYLWIGTMLGGLNRLDPATGLVRKYRHNSMDPTSLGDDFVVGIQEDRQGNLLIQTGKSLEVFDRTTEEFTSFGPAYGVNLGMPHALWEDSRGNLWIGTWEELYYFDRAGLQYRRYSTAEGLPSANITGILEDDAGHLWVSTMGGLVKFVDGVAQPDQPNFQVFTMDEGLQGVDFKERACYKGQDGTLYFGGQNGFNAFDPQQILMNPVVPPVVITGFRLFNEAVDFGPGQALEAPITQAREIHLNHRQNVFSFDFAALNFILPQKNQYAYRMEDFEEKWNYVGNQNTATYTNLDPGTYTFRVKAANNDGVWNEEGTAILLHISPPWWQTTSFRVAVVLALVLGTVVVFRLRVFQLKQRQKVLKLQVQAATVELQKVNGLLEDKNAEIERQNLSLVDKNDLLTQQNQELEDQANQIQALLQELQELSELKLRFFTNISHELRTPLTLILGPLEKLIGNTEQHLPAQREYEVMHRNARKLLKLINQLLDFRKIETGNMQLQAAQRDVVSFTREIFGTFTLMAERKGIAYSFEPEMPHFDLWFDGDKLEKVLTNALSNAFKHTPEGKSIRVTLGLTPLHEDRLSIQVKDTGAGIPKEQQTAIFDLYHQAQNSTNLEQAGTGIGLALIKQFVELHHGHLSLDSTVGQGTTLTVELPVGRMHLDPAELQEEESEVLAPTLAPQPLASTPAEAPEGLPPAKWEEQLEAQRTLLVVEDNPDIRHYIRQSLQESFAVHEAGNGLEGLERARELVPDLIISDVMMPEMDGFEMCEHLKTDERTSHVPVLMLTAYSGEERQREGLAAGADDYITKPFNVRLLQQKLLNMMQTRDSLIRRFREQPTLDISALKATEADQAFLKKAIAIIEDNLGNSQLTVEDFSEEFRMSRRNLLRKIKAVTGLSVTEFIRNIRLKKSVDLLQQGELNISEVAYSVGFSDPKYFSKCFRKEFGKSPSEFIGNAQEG